MYKNYIRKYRHNKILKAIDIPQNGTVLDLSCANGQFIKKLHNASPNLKFFGIDISDSDIEEAKINFPFATFSTENIEKLSFKENSFDFIFSIMSLHHYKNPSEFLKEVHRVLKPSGILYITDLIPKYSLTQKLQNLKGCSEPYHFEKFYLKKDLKKILEQFNFAIASDKKISSLPRIRLMEITRNA